MRTLLLLLLTVSLSLGQTITKPVTVTGTNTGDQISIVGITGTMSQFDTAVTDGNFVYQSGALGTPTSANFSSGTFTWPTFNQNTTGSAASLTTPRTIYGQTFDGSANIGSQIIVSGQSLTGSQATNTLDLSTTWNTSGNPSLIYGRVTNTASGASANLIDVGTVAGGSLFKVNKSGSTTLSGDITATSGVITAYNLIAQNFFTVGSAAGYYQVNSTYGAVIGTGKVIGFSSTTAGNIAPDSGFSRKTSTANWIKAGNGTANDATATFEAGTLISNGFVRLKVYTVATLPASPVAGDTAAVSDATTPTYLGALTGGGAVSCPVYYNGSAWVSH